MKKIMTMIMAAALLVGLASCSGNDEPGGGERRPQPIGVGRDGIVMEGWSPTATRLLSSAERGRRALGITRDDPATVAANIPETIGVLAVAQDLTAIVFDNQKMYYKDGTEILQCGFDYSGWPEDNLWPYDPPKYWRTGKNYKFYAYAPYTENVNVNSWVYDKFNSLSISKIPPIGTHEFMIADAMKIKKSGNEPTFSMVHLSARLMFSFAVGKRYSELRDIRVKSVSVDDGATRLYYYAIDIDLSNTTAQWQLYATNEIYDPGTEVIDLAPEYTPDGSGLPGMLLPTEEEGYSNFSSLYFLCESVPNVVMTVTYDVYDKKGQLLRQDQTASNIVDLSSIAGLEAGKYYNLRILVSPAYLYILSDNDEVPEWLIDVRE